MVWSCSRAVIGDAFPDAAARLAVVVRQSPAAFGIAQARWRLQDLPHAIPELAGYSMAGLSRLVHRAGIGYQRGRSHLHSPDPAYQAKMDRIVVAERMADRYPERVVVVYGDEASYYRQPTLADCLRPQREEPLAELGTKANYRHRVGAALNRQTGQVTWLAANRFTVATMRRFLIALRTAYPAHRLYLVWDNWPVHHHATVLAEAARLQIHIVWLPTYAPWENPIEKLWRWMKQVVLHHHQFADDWPGLKLATRAFLDQFTQPSPDLLRYTGLLTH